MTQVVLSIKSEPRCKLCSHERRDWIDALLLKRSLRQQDDTGRQVNLEYVLTALAGVGVENPTDENVKNHWKKHCEVIDEEKAGQIREREAVLFLDLIAEMPDSGDPVAMAEWQIKLWAAKERARIEAGGEPSVTTDQAQTAQKLIAASKTDQQTRQLLGGVATAIGQAFIKKALPPAAPALPAPDVVEVHVVSEEG